MNIQLLRAGIQSRHDDVANSQQFSCLFLTGGTNRWNTQISASSISSMFGAPPHSFEPLQLYHLNLPGIRCERQIPANALQDFIYYYWILTIELAQFDLDVIPDNAVDLVMSPEIPEFSAIYFPVEEKFTIPLTGPVVYVGTCFKATMTTTFFEQGLAQLKALLAGLETTTALDLSGLVTALQGCPDFPQITLQLDRFWEQRLQQRTRGPVAGLVKLDHQRWLDVIQRSLGEQSLQTIATHTGLSERQFRRISTQLFGLSPKKIQRVQRLQSAVRELFSADATMLEDHYYDESHRIRELKKLTGLTPGAIRRMAETYNQSN